MIGNIKKFINRNNSGYTLIEMMTILFIIGLISSIVLANYRRSEKQYILNSQAQALAQFIREAQNRALGTAIAEGQSDFFGYGVAFLKTTQPPYLPILYVDLNDNKRYDSNDLVIKYFDLNPIIKISTVTTNAVVAPDCLFPSEAYINFSPPEPITEISGNGGNCSYEMISIGLKPTDESLADRFVDIANTGFINIR